MEKIQTADIKVEKEEDGWCEMEAETTFHPTAIGSGGVGVKTEDGPARWVVCGDVVKREYGEFQQGLYTTTTGSGGGGVIAF